jgi:hypothetical protein
LIRYDSKTDGRWTRDEHLKFLEGKIPFRLRTENLWKKLEKNLAVSSYEIRLTDSLACAEVFLEAKGGRKE